ncbi:hypothetical protein HPB47_018805 [Ixodes persulcatus]|uniref:Uncharacterized protein n=1 Tax=Ixodes persulcatus TaxID=34615 RepID=A0AC60QLS0_IXOPE|nr:hypothetical protein HPB47_018805 [Ixodes persulcatus]
MIRWKKSRRAAGNSGDTVISKRPNRPYQDRKPEYIILYRPTDEASVKKINRGQIFVHLSAVAPKKLKEIRFNSRKNIVAVDVLLAEDALPAHLDVNDMCGTKASADIPSGEDVTTGGYIDKDLTEDVFKTMQTPHHGLLGVRHFG